MRILVTGGAGYIGSHIANRLAQLSYDVWAYDNLSTGFPEALSSRVPLVLGDILDQNTLLNTMHLHKISAVIHCAAKISVEESLQYPSEYSRTNSKGTESVVNACIENGIKTFVFSSTAAVYGEVPDHPVDENTACCPINPYGASKLEAELIIRQAALQTPAFNYINLRYFNVVGGSSDGSNGQRYLSKALFSMAAQAALKLEPSLTINGINHDTKDGSCIRDYIHIDDLVEAHILALKYADTSKMSDTLNCGYGAGYSVLEVVKQMSITAHYDFPVIQGPKRPNDPRNVIANNRRIMEKLSWAPRYNNLEYMCRSTLNWFKKYHCEQL